MILDDIARQKIRKQARESQHQAAAALRQAGQKLDRAADLLMRGELEQTPCELLAEVAGLLHLLEVHHADESILAAHDIDPLKS